MSHGKRMACPFGKPILLGLLGMISGLKVLIKPLFKSNVNSSPGRDRGDDLLFTKIDSLAKMTTLIGTPQ
jgi:hypothetical protein